MGEKTAIKLLAEYGTLENIYANLDEIGTSIRNKLEKSKDDAELSQRLAQIVTDLQIDYDLDQARTDHFNPNEVQALFRELEFRSLSIRLDKLIGTQGMGIKTHGDQLSLFTDPEVLKDEVEQAIQLRTMIVDSPETLEQLVSNLENANQISFDTETTSTDQMQATLVGISIAR